MAEEGKNILKEVIGEEMLNKIQDSYLQYLESSAAIYELNGEYAAALFTSQYCDFLNKTSRKLGGKTDKEALASGRWICHEDCWAVSNKSIKERRPCELECSGGIRIFAVPIIVDGEVIGSNNAGVSNPPTDEKKIKEIAAKYKVDASTLMKTVKDYTPKPEYVFAAARNHIKVTAETIKELFLRRRAERNIKDTAKFPSENPYPVLRVSEEGAVLYSNEAGAQLLKKWRVSTGIKIPLDWQYIAKDALKAGVVKTIEREDKDRVFAFTIVPVKEEGYVNLYGLDITEQKMAGDELKTTKQNIEYILGVTKTGLDIIDANYNMVYIDPEWQKVYGEYKGRKCYEYYAGRKEICPDCGISQAMKTRKPVVKEEVLPREGNRVVEVTTIPFQNEKGQWLFAEVNVDITARKAAEEQIKRHAEDLEKLNDKLRRTMDELQEKDQRLLDTTRGLKEVSAESMTTKDEQESIPHELAAQKEFLSADKERLVAILQQIGEGIIVINDDKEVELINNRAKGLLGYNADEEIPEGYKKSFALQLWRELHEAQDEIVKKELKIQRPKEAGMVITLVRLHGRGGGFVAVMRDI